jgi:hypothetical protein
MRRAPYTYRAVMAAPQLQCADLVCSAVTTSHIRHHLRDETKLHLASHPHCYLLCAACSSRCPLLGSAVRCRGRCTPATAAWSTSRSAGRAAGCCRPPAEAASRWARMVDRSCASGMGSMLSWFPAVCSQQDALQAAAGHRQRLRQGEQCIVNVIVAVISWGCRVSICCNTTPPPLHYHHHLHPTPARACRQPQEGWIAYACCS